MRIFAVVLLVAPPRVENAVAVAATKESFRANFPGGLLFAASHAVLKLKEMSHVLMKTL
jgi:hypothetical protein